VVTVDGLPAPAEVRTEDARTSITVEHVPARAALRIGVGARPRLRDNDVARRLFALLDRAQMEIRTKSRVWEILTSDRSLAVRLSALQALDLDDALATAIGEILLAKPQSEEV
jgi:hypothetical protein